VLGHVFDGHTSPTGHRLARTPSTSGWGREQG